MFWRCKNTCCKNWHHLLSKSSISLSFGHSASGFFQCPDVHQCSSHVWYVFEGDLHFLICCVLPFQVFQCHHDLLSVRPHTHRQISAWEHSVNGTGYFNRISKKGKKQRTCKASVWSNEITKRFLIQAWLGWFHGLMKEISQFGLHWPMHNSSMRQGRHKRCKRANTNDSTMQQFVMFTPLLSTAISSSSVYCNMMQAPDFFLNLGVDLREEDPPTSSGAGLKRNSSNAKMPSHTTLALYRLSGHSALLNFLLSPYLKQENDYIQVTSVWYCMTAQL